MKTHLRVAAALIVAVGSTPPAWAQFGPAPGHHGDRGHGAADARLYDNHYQRDVYRNDRHVRQDLHRYGTTNPYSSPGHFYGDRARQRNHGAVDQHGNADHAARDRNAAGAHHYPRRTYFGH